jgi:hypothetical protein
MDGIQVRQQLDEILSSIEEREQVIAKALEDLTVDSAMTACWDQATRHERYRVLTLIDNQLEQLSAAGMNAILLRTLRGVVANG